MSQGLKFRVDVRAVTIFEVGGEIPKIAGDTSCCS